MERLNSLFVLLLLIFLCSLAKGTNGDCNLENGKTGAKWCKDAYSLALDNNKDKMILHPKNTACCLSYNMGNCVQHSFEKADCSSSNKKLEAVVTEEVENAQKEANKMASTLGSFICGDDLSESKCRNLAEEFNKAQVKINQLNGASTITPFLAIVCSLLVLFYS